MRTSPLLLLGFIVAAGAFSREAHAEEPAQVEHPDFTLVIEEPADRELLYYDFKRQQLEESARRSRNALIGLGATLAVGAAVYFPLAVRCIVVYAPEGSQPACGRGAEAGFITSGFVLGAGFFGTIVTGIMLGVRKGKLRRLDDRHRQRDLRAVSWDPDRGRFEF
jgi:hypothetical protein